MKNKFGLSRYIPEPIKREVRQSCGYGCVVCGNAIYEYEHIDPEFSNAKKHDPERIALLCSICHSYVTRNIWSKAKILKARSNPFCFESGVSKFSIDIDSSKEFIVSVCGNTFIKTPKIIEIDDKNILTILPPEDSSYPIPRISASFFDTDNNEIAWISENEWFGSSKVFDIQTTGNKITIREKLGKLNLELRFLPPNNISIERINLTYNNVNVTGTIDSSFKINTPSSKIEVPKGDSTPCKVPFWISVKGVKIFIGSTNVINYETLKGNKYKLPGYYEIIDSKLRIDKKSDQNQNSLIIKTSDSGGGVGIHYDLPETEKIMQPIRLNWKLNTDEKCFCGSQKPYNDCCKYYFEKLENLLNSSYELQQCNFEVQRLFKKDITYQFNDNLNGHVSFGFDDKNIVIKLRRDTGLSLSNLAFAFISAKYYHKGFFTVPSFFTDIRQRVIKELSDNLFHIPVIAEMSRKGFSNKEFLSPTLTQVKKVLLQRNEKDLSKLPLTRIHYEAIVFLRINYEGLYLSRLEKAEIEDLFQMKSPISLVLGKNLIKIINRLNPYEKDGNYEVNYNCISYLNENGENKRAYDYSTTIYDKYVKMLEKKLTNIVQAAVSFSQKKN